ncbi:putative Na+/H+ antiporter [Caenimonas aquaedulcis]|uniref:Na+/H+ antiporter n=1 Tax=Caenimonas aquaedulcis TaxID=2793270 RepID=A0A931MIX8_9BURK|nr:putative Na+/H+ antiporter [Caenimonas aquaedulcis]MBG9390616.1 putative Na+/H+ antiporter [Caenimonas aquaedulcis]
MHDTPSTLQLVAAALFAVALVHTFAAKQVERLSTRYPRHAGLFHLLGEIEVVFGFWAIVLVAVMAILAGPAEALQYAESRQYTEPLFVFVVMVVSASRPILVAVSGAMQWLADRLPVDSASARAWLSLALVPLLGSLITEPAAMTIAALALAPQIFRREVPEWPKYLALGVLFVNVSIGGTLTSFAAPPVLMVAANWDWDSAFMARTFGWKAALAVFANATVATWLIRKHLAPRAPEAEARDAVPACVVAVHLMFLAAVVVLAHHPVAFVALLLMFIAYTQAYPRHQDALLVKEALLVSFFLAGLVVLGGMQEWWLQPIVAGMSPGVLFFGAAGLTAVMDNAALTYMGSLIEGIPDAAKYSLVAGAVAGGGLTVIANAPNPAGVALLKEGFADGTIGAAGLLAAAAGPTAVALAVFWLL